MHLHNCGFRAYFSLRERGVLRKTVLFSFQRIHKALQPNDIWGPALLENRRNYKYAKEYSTDEPLLDFKI